MFTTELIPPAFVKRYREEFTEDTEDEQHRSQYLQQPQIATTKSAKVVNSPPLPGATLYRNRELLQVIYSEQQTIIIEKVHNTPNFVITYRDNDYSTENNYHPFDRCYIGTFEECQALHPAFTY